MNNKHYEKLLFSKIKFRKVNDKLNITINNNEKDDILNFVTYLNDNNVDYEKKEDEIIIQIRKQQQAITNESLLQTLFNKLIELNIIHGKFYYPDLKDGIISLHDCYGSSWKIKFTKNNDVDIIEVIYRNTTNRNNQILKIPCSNENDMKPDKLYIMLCVMNKCIIECRNNTITFPRLTLVWLKEDSWLFTLKGSSTCEYDTTTLLFKLQSFFYC